MYYKLETTHLTQSFEEGNHHVGPLPQHVLARVLHHREALLGEVRK